MLLDVLYEPSYSFIRSRIYRTLRAVGLIIPKALHVMPELSRLDDDAFSSFTTQRISTGRQHSVLPRRIQLNLTDNAVNLGHYLWRQLVQRLQGCTVLHHLLWP